jgi:hypothetical protein
MLNSATLLDSVRNLREYFLVIGDGETSRSTGAGRT